MGAPELEIPDRTNPLIDVVGIDLSYNLEFIGEAILFGLLPLVDWSSDIILNIEQAYIFIFGSFIESSFLASSTVIEGKTESRANAKGP